MGKTAENIERLDVRISNDVRVLLFPKEVASPGADAAPAGESAPSEGDRGPSSAAPPPPPPVTDKQMSRLMIQAQKATSLVLKGELECSKLHLQRMEEAELVARTEKPLTDADLKLANAKVSTLMDKAAVVYRDLPLLGIAANVVESSRLAHKRNTVLAWTREFRRLGGFLKRDERGV